MKTKNWTIYFLGMLIPICFLIIVSLICYPESHLRTYSMIAMAISFIVFILARIKELHSIDIVITWILCGGMGLSYFIF